MGVFNSTSVFFNIFAAGEPYVCSKSLTEPHAMIRASSGIGEVKVL